MNTIVIEKGSRKPNFKKQDGLIPVIIQNQEGKVLMLAYTNQEAFKLTLETGFAHFWSRSRKKLWKKGETSGNVLLVISIWLDCDQDTLLYTVFVNGPACHLGKKTCFTSIGKQKLFHEDAWGMLD